MTTRFNQRQVLFIISISLVAATLAAYEPIRHNGFVNYDDSGYITENPNVTGGITQQSFKWALTTLYAANWHPLTWLSHMADCRISGLNPLGHHFVSVAIHIANTLLLFWILKNITGTIWAGAFVAAVFALHPLQVESVAWAAERKTVLSGLFWLLTMAAYIHYARKPGFGRYMLLLFVFGLCIMTKPTVVTLPLVLLLLDYWPLERIRRGQSVAATSKSAIWLIAEKTPLLAMSAALSVITIIAQKGGKAVISLDIIPLDTRIANVFSSYIKYIGKLVWPSGLAVFYPPSYPAIPKTTTAVYILLFILITAISIYIGRHRKYMAVGWLWFVGTLVPMIGLVQAGFQVMANRYMYLSMLGLLIIIALAVKELIAKHPRLKTIVAIMGVISLSCLLVLTRMQVRHWQNSITLFEYALKTTKNNPVIETYYGCALFYEAGRLDEAEKHLSNAVRISPTFAKALSNLGRVYIEQGKTNEAISCFTNLLRQNENSAETHYDLALSLGMQKKYDEAIKHLAKTLEIEPNYPDAHNRTGIALMAIGKPDEAIKYFDEALRINKDKSEVYGNLGTAYMRLDKYGPGIYNFNKAIEQKPDSIVNLNRLAWALATVEDTSLRDANKAIEAAGRACELTGNNDAEYLDTLAVTYAAAGRFEEAKATAKKALSIVKSSDREDLAGEIQERIKLYEAGQPYRQK
ncbi:MAG: tetratricopeptide repeat protein [Sedimentisphaerales bacterium]|jgi:tetratricopeptide (TPR) repeat protein